MYVEFSAKDAQTMTAQGLRDMDNAALNSIFEAIKSATAIGSSTVEYINDISDEHKEILRNRGFLINSNRIQWS